MKIDKCYELGIISRTHGLKGEVIMFLDVDFPEEYATLDSVFVEVQAKKLVPYFIKALNLQGKTAITSFEEIDTIEKAQALMSCKLYLPLDVLPELEEGDFYLHEIIDYQIIDVVKGQLGKVNAIYNNGNQDLIAMTYQSKEVLIPIVDEIVKNANHETKELTVELPEGLLELYLEE